MQVVQLFYIEHQIGGCTGQFGGLKNLHSPPSKKRYLPKLFLHLCLQKSPNSFDDFESLSALPEVPSKGTTAQL